MDVLNACQCCLLRPPDMDLRTYHRLDQAEIYSDMLKECFQIHVEHSVGPCGICVVCISRLRDACDFKHQVESCQAKLQTCLTQGMSVKEFKEESSDYEDAKQEDGKLDEPQRLMSVTVKVEPGTEMTGCGSSPGPDATDEPAASETPKQPDCEATGNQKLLQCQHCDQQFTISSLLDVHLKRHKDTSVSSHTQSSSKTLKKIRTKKVHSCELCMKQFKLKSGLVTHMRIHTGDKPYSCEVCKKQFTNKRNMIYHSQTHTGEKPYTCEVCLNQFSNKSNLTVHMRLHARDKPFSCELCSKQFKIKYYLVTHMRRHKGIKPYSCDVCKKRFSQKNNLEYHKKIHTGEKPYTCEVCKKQFIGKYSMMRHSRSHTKES